MRLKFDVIFGYSCWLPIFLPIAVVLSGSVYTNECHFVEKDTEEMKWNEWVKQKIKQEEDVNHQQQQRASSWSTLKHANTNTLAHNINTRKIYWTWSVVRYPLKYKTIPISYMRYAMSQMRWYWMNRRTLNTDNEKNEKGINKEKEGENHFLMFHIYLWVSVRKFMHTMCTIYLFCGWKKRPTHSLCDFDCLFAFQLFL